LRDDRLDEAGIVDVMRQAHETMGVGRPERRLDRPEQGGVCLRIVEGIARRVEH
jgi:hypothetical protein